jgi:hypothetical protein
MITFIASRSYTHTFAALRRKILSQVVPETRAITYDELFAADELQPGTYVFTDIERLHPAEVRLAARFFRQLDVMPGFRVLNDPARVKPRYALLRALAEAGLNDFDVYWADGFPRPRRFPIFLRFAADHAGPLGDLVHDQGELEARLRSLEADGIPLTGVLAVEFCSERNARGHYEKLAFFKIGDRVTLSALLIGEHWNVKIANASMKLVTPEIMREQLEAMRADRDAEKMRAVFDIAGIDYGRADVGICGGRFQVYEINTNPNITASKRFISDEHRESREIFRARFGAMMHAIDSPAGRAVPVNLGPLDKTLRRRREIARATVTALNADRRSGFRRIGEALRGCFNW